MAIIDETGVAIRPDFSRFASDVRTEGRRLGSRFSEEFDRSGRLEPPRGARDDFEREGRLLGRRAGRGVAQEFPDAAERGLLGPLRRIAGQAAGIFAGAFVIGKVTDLFHSVVEESRESIKVGKLSAQVIKTTGGAAKITAEQVGDLATAISNKTAIDDEAIQSAENLLLTFTNVRNEAGKGNDIFNQATRVLTDMSVVLGQDTSAGAIQLGKALNDPIRGVTALSRVGVSFTEQQKQQIKTLVEHGKTLEAQKIILAELGKEFGGAAEAAADPLQRLSVRVGNVKEAIGTFLMPVVTRAADFLIDTLIPGVEHLADAFATGFSFREFTGTDAPRLIGAWERIGYWIGVAWDFTENVIVGFTGISRKVGNLNATQLQLGGKLRAIADQITDVVLPAVDGIKDALTTGWSTIRPDLTEFGRSLFEGARRVAQNLIDGVRTGLDTGDWEPLGRALGDGLAEALASIVEKGNKLSEAITAWFESVDWLELGKKASAIAVPFAIGFANDLIVNLLRFAKDNPLDMAVFILTFIPLGRVAGLLAKVLGKIPIVGPLLRLLESAGGAIEGGLMRFVVRPLERLGGFVLKALLDGFRTVFPKAGAELAFQLSLLPLRIAAAGIRVAIAAGKMIGGLIGAIRGQLELVGAQAALIVARLLRPFTGAGGWLVGRGREIVAGLVRGLGNVADRIGPVLAVGRKKVFDFFANARGWLYNAGKLIVQGLIDGLRFMVRKVGDAAGAVAKEIRDHFPHSPAKKGPLRRYPMDRAGRNIVKSLMDGLDAETPQMQATLDALTGLIRDQVVGAAATVGRPLQAPLPPLAGTSVAAPGASAPPGTLPGVSGPQFISHVTVHGTDKPERTAAEVVLGQRRAVSQPWFQTLGQPS